MGLTLCPSGIIYYFLILHAHHEHYNRNKVVLSFVWVNIIQKIWIRTVEYVLYHYLLRTGIDLFYDADFMMIYTVLLNYILPHLLLCFLALFSLDFPQPPFILANLPHSAIPAPPTAFLCLESDHTSRDIAIRHVT